MQSQNREENEKERYEAIYFSIFDKTSLTSPFVKKGKTYMKKEIVI